MSSRYDRDRAELLSIRADVERDAGRAPELRVRTMEIGSTIDDDVARTDRVSPELGRLHELSLLVRGILLVKMSKYPQAQLWLEKAQRTYPYRDGTDPAISYYRGWALLSQGENEEAIDSFTTSIAIDDRAPAAFLGRALAWKRTGETDYALSDISVVLRYEPNNDLALRTKREIAGG